MIIFAPSQALAEKRYWIGNIALFVAALVWSVCSLTSLALQKDGGYSPSMARTEGSVFSEESIGYGPLALNGVRQRNPVPNLTRELTVLARNHRPGTAGDETALLLGLKSTQEELIAFNGQALYLKRGVHDTFTFSSEPTSLVIVPLAMEGKEVLMTVVSGEQKGEFILKETPKSSKALEKTAFVKALKSGKWWGPDLFLENYGGADYRSLLGKHKLEFADSVCYVSEGDYLIWENETWKPAPTSPLSPFLPIAQVSAITSKGVQIEAWDETGFGVVSVQLAHPKVPRVNHKMEELVTAARPRAASELSCVLGKRRVVLREGDWWLKTAAGWRHLKKLGDIEDYLEHRARGELFIFESIAMEKGKAVIKGQCFDTMRTQMQPIALNVSTEKKDHFVAKNARSEKQKSHLIAKTEKKIRRIQIPQFQEGELEEKPTP